MVSHPGGGHPLGETSGYMYYVYVVQSLQDQTTYIGYSADLKKRIFDHNQGKTKSIKHKIPVRLIYYEAYNDKRIARMREIELKKHSFKKKELFKRIFNKARSSSG